MVLHLANGFEMFFPDRTLSGQNISNPFASWQHNTRLHSAYRSTHFDSLRVLFLRVRRVHENDSSRTVEYRRRSTAGQVQ